MAVYKLIGTAKIRTWTCIEAASVHEGYELCRRRAIGFGQDGFDPNDTWVIDDEPDQTTPKLIASEVLLPDEEM